MSPDVGQGLYVTVAGMGLVFLSLGILMLAMMTLDRVFRRPPTKKTAQNATPTSTEPLRNDEALVAALAVALARSQEETRPTLRVAAAEESRTTASAWSLLGRQRLMNSRNPRGR